MKQHRSGMRLAQSLKRHHVALYCGIPKISLQNVGGMGLVSDKFESGALQPISRKPRRIAGSMAAPQAASS